MKNLQTSYKKSQIINRKSQIFAIFAVLNEHDPMRKLCFACLLTLMLCLSSVLTASAQEFFSLEGSWDLSLNDSTHYDDYVMLPGSLETNQKGGGGFAGDAWYKKTVYIPREWKQKRVTLFLERCSAETTVYVNGRQVGHQASRFTPHQYDVSSFIVPGYRNSIAVREKHQGEWNGVLGRMELCAQSRYVSIKQVIVSPELVNGKLLVTVLLDCEYHPRSYIGYDNLTVMVTTNDSKESIVSMGAYDIVSRKMTMLLPVNAHFTPWDEFSPKLFRLSVGVSSDYYETTFGICQAKADGNWLSVNGRPLFLRGVVENSLIPKTGYSPADELPWTEMFTEVKKYGLNHVRFRSYCPPEAAFVAADQLGVYLSLEGLATPEEQNSIIETYGHHPSLLMASVGEAGDGWKVPMITCQQEQEGQALCYKQEIERHLSTEGSTGFLLSSLDECSNVAGDDWREFCSPLVILAHFPKFEYTSADTLRVPVEVCNALYGQISPIRKTYFITEGERVITGGGLSSDSIPMGNTDIGTVVFPLDGISEPTKLTLTVRIGKDVLNHWDFWVRPEATKQEDNLNE